MLNRALAEVDRRIEEVQRQRDALDETLTRLRQLRQMVAYDPLLGEEVLRIGGTQPNVNGSTPTPASAVSVSRRSSDEVLKLIQSHFESVQNEWQSVREISKATGVSQSSLNSLLYTSRHKDAFESHLDSPRRRVFRLKGEGPKPAQPRPSGPRPKHIPYDHG